MKSHFKVKVPLVVRRALKAWIANYRKDPAAYPSGGTEGCVSEIERLAKNSAATGSISLQSISLLATTSATQAMNALQAVHDLRESQMHQETLCVAETILVWCRTVVDLSMFNIHIEFADLDA